MFIAYFMAFVLSCETMGSIRVLGGVVRPMSRLDTPFLQNEYD
jgi:hypothetical protein